MDEKSSLKELLCYHIYKRPMIQAQDVYKLLYQGVFGVSHILSESAWERLVEESERIDLNAHPEDPLIENVSPDSKMIRVNLRQYINRKYSLEILFDIMKESSKHVGDEEKFLEYWGFFREMVVENIFSLDMKSVEYIDELIRIDGVVPRHHTKEYREAYYPAYRVVKRNLIEKYCDLR